MKSLNKFAAIVLSCVLLINNSNIVHAMKNVETANDVQTYNVPVISNEYPNSTVTFYGYDGKYYLSLEDIKDFTRCELDESDSQLTLTHGLRKITIEKDTGHMTDSDFVDQGDIDIFEYDGKYLCEGIPMLVYLGAACTVRNDKALEVLMPSITIWESIMPDYLDYYFNVIELYGGENNVKISLALDIISDVLDGVSGHGLNANADTHLEDALYEILNVDMMKYESVQESILEQNQKNQNFFTANADIILKSGESAKDAVATAITEYAESYFNVQIAKSEFKWQRAYQSGDLESASELSLQINQQVYNQSATKVNLEKADNAFNIGMIALNTAITSYNLMQYDDDTRNLFKRSINNEIFDYTDYHDISWNNVSDKISDTLSSNASIVASSASKNVVDFINGEITKKGIEKALSGFTSKANIYLTAAQIGSFVASLINYKSNQAFSADMNAIWLNTVQYDIAQLASRMLIKERDEYHFSDAESLNKLKDMFTLYYRMIIAFSENMAVSVDELGGKNRKEWVQYFSATSGKSVSNYAAIYLYRITNCTIVPIVNYTKLADEVLNNDWISNFKHSIPDVMQYLNNYEGLINKLGITLKEETNNFDRPYLSAETEGFHFNYWLDDNSLDITSDNFSEVSVNGVVCGTNYVKAQKLLSQNNWYDVTIDEGDESDTGLEYKTFATYINDTYYQLVLGYDPEYTQVKNWTLYNFCTDYTKGILIYNSVNEDWKKAYIHYIMENGMNYDSMSNSYREIYKLVNIDGDDIPELYTNFGSTAGGDTICTYQGDDLNYQYMWNYGFSYIEGKNMFIDSGGHMDSYYDIVYTIENGSFKKLFEGDYGAPDNSHVQWNENDPVYEYFVNGVQVSSKEEYLNALKKIYNTENDNNPYDNTEYDNAAWRYVGNGLCNYEEIIEAIKNY